MNIVTYEARSTVKPEHSWVAYIVLPNGEYLGIMFRDATEDGVKAKAEKFWAENYKPRPIAEMVNDEVVDSNGVTHGIGRGHHFAGKVWMVNVATREKRRVAPDQVAALGEGWVRGGPRS